MRYASAGLFEAFARLSFDGKKRRVRVDVKSLDIKITHASEVIEMGEAPGQAIRKKKNSSIVLTVNSVATGSSDA